MAETMEAYSDLLRGIGTEQYKHFVEWIECLIAQHQAAMTTCAPSKLEHKSEQVGPDASVDDALDAAIRHALQRKAAGKSPFAGDEDEVLPLPMSEKEEYSQAWRNQQ